MKCSKQSGFTLVELAIVVMIAGLLVGTAISMVKPYMQSVQRNTTQVKLEKISQALALFAQQYGRLPCPGDPTRTDTTTAPFGSPRNAGTNGTDILGNRGCSSTATANYKGIVPFRALGLDEGQVRDSYGNLITYAVNRALTLHTPDDYDPNDADERIHEACRMDNIWITGSSNLNPKKAHICCAQRSGTSSPTDSDINIFSERMKTNRLILPERNTSAPYGNPNAAGPTTPALDSKFVAFVLVSHGLNGDGAYLGRGPGVRSVTTAAAVTEEAENRDHALNNLDFVARSANSINDPNYFDDIVVWKTNDQLISMFGNDSCVRP